MKKGEPREVLAKLTKSKLFLECIWTSHVAYYCLEAASPVPSRSRSPIWGYSI